MFHVRHKTLIRFVDGRLGSEEEARVRRHLSRCPRCARIVEQLEAMEQLAHCQCDPVQLHLGEEPASPCCEPEDLFGYCRGTLSGDRSRQVRAHLRQCGVCANLVESFLEEELLSSVEATRTRQEAAGVSRSRFSGTRLAWGSGGAGLALVVSLVLVFWWQGAGVSPSYEFAVMGQHRYAVRSQDEFKLAAGGVLYGGDRIRLQVEPQSDLYLYVLLFTSTGSAQGLFPSPSISVLNPLKKGEACAIPPSAYWPLDETRGTETLFLVTSSKPLPEMKQVPRKLEETVNAFSGDSARIDAAERYLRDRFDDVRAFSFEHK